MISRIPFQTEPNKYLIIIYLLRIEIKFYLRKTKSYSIKNFYEDMKLVTQKTDIQ